MFDAVDLLQDVGMSAALTNPTNLPEADLNAIAIGMKG